MALEDSTLNAPITFGVIRNANGKPKYNYHPWILRANELLIKSKDSVEDLRAYYDFLRTKPDELRNPKNWILPSASEDLL